MVRQGKWQCWQASSGKAKGQWYFHLKSANGQVVLQSEGYLKKKAMLDTIKAIQKNALNEIYMV